MAGPDVYVGSELELFREARNWKRYLRAQIEPYVQGDVLEVGAGIGGSTLILHAPTARGWTCLEPDASLAGELGEAVGGLRDAGGAPPRVEVGTVRGLRPGLRYDTLLYVDVLEHVADDRGELEDAAQRLRPGGHLVVMSPAHQWLFTPFDAAIGHHRRYAAAELAACAPRSLELARLRYLDAAGIVASLGNRVLLRAPLPTPRQIAIWDRWLVPISRRLDPLLGYAVGKSVLAVWRQPEVTAPGPRP
jgi:SAM-dependent methyltransferase